MYRSRLTGGFILFVSFFAVMPLSAQLPDDFFDSPVVTGLEFPTGITFAENGQGYVWEKSGLIYTIDSLGNQLPTPFLDLREEISNWNDHGLSGFCLDNDFLSNGYVYLLYALDLHYYEHFGTPAYHPDSTVLHRPTIGRITRFTADPATGFQTILPDSRRVLLGKTLDDGIPLLYEFHGLGTILQAEDGTLLVSCGDATSNAGTDYGGDEYGTMASAAIAAGVITPDQDLGSYRAQYLGAYNGKVLRIDPETGEGLPSNPFFSSEAPSSAQSRAWALGLRNPYRMTLRPNTGSHYSAEGNPGVLYIGDVGNGRIVQAKLGYHQDAKVPLRNVPDQE
ncbi:MAG: PQQ-dependent sugar dehydrogenase [Lewinella sp.]|nr:PQQ-dependent sugar dehydrogenase [Lewinella sp.]